MSASARAALSHAPNRELVYQDRVNPQWGRLLDILQMNARYTRCEGTELFTDRGRVNKVFFCSSGSEAVEAAIKFSRAHTRRNGLPYADGAFHGLRCGALSLMGDPFWRESFGPMLPGTEAVWSEALGLARRAMHI